MKSIVISSLGLIFVTSALFGCSSDSNKSSKKDLYDVSGSYNVSNKNSSRVSIVEVSHSNDLKDVSVRLSREGLSQDEVNYFANKGNLYYWADDNLGRVLRLGEYNFDLQSIDQQNTKSGDDVVLSACSRTIDSPLIGLSFVYCLEAKREISRDLLRAELLLFVLEDGKVEKTIVTPFQAQSNQRWSSQYLGHWKGSVDIRSSHKSDLNIQTGDVFNYDLIARGSRYYVLPKDINRVIVYKGERFILFPEELALTDLETSTTPYFNFRYFSEERGERRLRFNGHLRSAKRIEGNITLYKGRGKRLITLGTYVLEKK